MPDLVVLHYTAMPTAEEALARLCDPAVEVSAHYLICERGRVWQLVDEDKRAWHAGTGAWGDIVDVNSRSIGIELANDAVSPFPEPQMQALEDLIADICNRRKIAPSRVIAHSDCAPGRKVDPGPRFDWARLVRRGLAVAVAIDAPGDFIADLRLAGYTGSDDASALLQALRLRHRPAASGPLDDADRGLARGLARHFGVDARGGGA